MKDKQKMITILSQKEKALNTSY